MNEACHHQVQLLLTILPEVAKEPDFALHGGTAINLFDCDMPRLSVDIDLTWAPIAERQSSLDAIHGALEAVGQKLVARHPDMHVQHNRRACKLQVTTQRAAVKVEVNTVGRGLWGEARVLPLCEGAQTQFEAFCAVSVVSHAQLYGGKLCAALDRQHPRDLFDVKWLLDKEGLTDAVRTGLILALLSSNRPTHELLAPNLLDQRAVFERQFVGMAVRPFSYADYEATRLALVSAVQSGLTRSDKTFLLQFNRLQPSWDGDPFAGFPAVRWKLRNLQRFRQENPQAWAWQLDRLVDLLGD